MTARFGLRRAAGPVAAILLALLAQTSVAESLQLAITVDDLPSHSALPPGVTRLEVAKKIIAAFKEANLPPVYGFVNGDPTIKEPGTEGVLEAWHDAGFPLGNHSWSHMNLNQNFADKWEYDVLRDEPLLASLMKDGDWHWFRYPFLAEGETPAKRAAARELFAERGYKLAAVTMSFGDYMWNGAYARCAEKKDKKAMADLEKSYLAAAAESADYSRALSKTLYGRDIPYVLLMHIGAFDAVMFPRLLDLYKSKGYTFVTLEEAEKDPYYHAYVDPSQPATPNGLEAEMGERKLPLPAHKNYGPELDAMCK